MKEIEYSSDITIKNLDFLSGCKALNIIKITKCINLSDIYGISNFKNVTEIDFSSCGIVNLNPIRNFDKLETLNLTDNSLNNEIYDENVNKNINNIEILLELNKLKLKNIYLLKNKFNDTSELKKLQVSESSQIPT